ncbi:MAG: beta-galactosidase, partial [Candidatus Hydrogenedentes bacterium]|nr:beta-galactosidase [Candidatus Hydrogenedentota bacterium]
MAEFITDHRFIVGNHTLSPFSAEMHYYRVARDKWRACLESIRDAHIQVVSTLVPWNLHEYEENSFDFAGTTDERTDLVGFLELCAEMELYVILRPGPRISGEWPNGGYPAYLFDHPELIALDSHDQPARAYSCVSRREEYAVSYLNPRFVGSVEMYYRELIDAIQDYIYPQRPVFLIQLDNETSWSFRNGPFDVDYNPQVVRSLYPAFLEEKYGRIERMNEIYGTTYGLFSEVEPPRSCSVSEASDLPSHFDWLEFKENHLVDFHKTLRDIFEKMHVRTGFCVNLRGSNDYVLPANWSQHEDAAGLVTLDWYWPELYYQGSRYFRYLRTCSKTGRIGEMMAGLWADEPDQMQLYKPVTPEMQRYCILAALAAGIKSANFYMFVERGHWY